VIRDVLLRAVAGLFFGSELTLAIVRRARAAAGAKSADRESLAVLWVVITLAIMGAIAVSPIPAGRMTLPASAVRAVALAFLVGGMAFRWWAVITLGRFFTVDVATYADHALVDHGPFRWVRHPSYTGLLSAFFGVGVAMGSWLSVLALMPPIVFALAYRMRVEEAALRAALGSDYDAYCARTKRILPGIV
jgi:protein-S-isoprenylcysteine O-methyltransferase